MDRTDEDLIERYLQQGCRACLDELVERNLSLVRGLIYPMIGHAGLSDDLSQETFFLAIRGLANFRGQASFKTWLARIALNVVRNHLRKASRRRDVGEVDYEEVLASHCPPEKPAEDQEMAIAIERAILALPAVLREAVSMVCLQGIPVGEAAKVAECSVGSMYWRVHQARKKLKIDLADYL